MATDIKLPTATAAQFQASPPKPLEEAGLADSQLVEARTGILYGDSGLGKSTNLAEVAKKMYELTGKPVRLVAFEDSSKTVFQPLIDAGIVEAVFVSKARQPLVVLRRLGRGEWPVFAENGEFKSWRPASEAANYSAYIIEGLTSGAESVLEDQRENHRMMREQKGDAFEIGGEKFAVASQTAIYFTQAEMIRAIKAFGMLPVDRVFWSAHEAKGIEEDTKIPIRGPGIVGSAATDKVRKYVGLLLHIEGVPNPSTKIVEPRIYYGRHADPNFPQVFYPAKTTIPLVKVEELKKLYPNGYFEPRLQNGRLVNSLADFIEVEIRLVREATESLAKWKAEVDAKRKQ
jgi:hypothetical protein